MRIVITEWALDAYRRMIDQHLFSEADYWSTIRPDIQRLFDFPSDPRFGDSNFWGPAKSNPSQIVRDGFKLKWHNLGPGQIQLRLGVALLGSTAWLCGAWNKTSRPMDHLASARLAKQIEEIRAHRAITRGFIRDTRPH